MPSLPSTPRKHLRRPPLFQDRGDGGGEYLEIKQKRPLADVRHVQFHPLVEGRGISPADLPKTRDTRPDTASAAMPVLAETRIVAQGEGARTDQAHVALQYIVKLGQLIQARSTQEFTDSRDPGIVFDLERRPVQLIEMFQCFLDFLGIGHHGSEFQEAKLPFVESDSFLGKKYRSRRTQFYQ